MLKGIFYNQRSITENSETKKVSTVSYVSKKNKVDINKLLNRVKIEKKNQNKKKNFIFKFRNFTYNSYGNFYISYKISYLSRCISA